MTRGGFAVAAISTIVAVALQGVIEECGTSAQAQTQTALPEFTGECLGYLAHKYKLTDLDTPSMLLFRDMDPKTSSRATERMEGTHGRGWKQR